MLEKTLDWIGDVMIEISDYIYSLTSGLLCGEEEPPECIK